MGNIYQILINGYDTVLGVFPIQVRWIITLLILVGFVGVIFRLAKSGVVVLIVAILLLPFLLPVLRHFFMDLYAFFKFLISQLGATAPK